MIKINLPLRAEIQERYEANRYINELIEKAFNESKERFDSENVPNSAIIKTPIRTVKAYGNVPYGLSGKTLKEAGCAVFTFEHGLRSRNIQIELKTLAYEIQAKGYYLYGKGTYHMLFDHYGLRRASDVTEVFDNLQMGKIVTVLVKNSVYYGDSSTESHFVNLVGIKDNKFIVDDSNFGRKASKIETILEATRVAWLW